MHWSLWGIIKVVSVAGVFFLLLYPQVREDRKREEYERKVRSIIKKTKKISYKDILEQVGEHPCKNSTLKNTLDFWEEIEGMVKKEEGMYSYNWNYVPLEFKICKESEAS